MSPKHKHTQQERARTLGACPEERRALDPLLTLLFGLCLLLLSLSSRCARLSDPQFSQNAAALPTILDIVSVISELFLSLSSQDIPAAFEEKATLQGWMSRFLELFTFQSAVLEAQAAARKGDDALAPTKLDTLRSTICEIINVYTWKYEDYFAEFVPKFVEVIWQTLASLSDSARYDALVGSAVRFLTAVVRKAQFSSLFSSEAALNLIAEKVRILPNSN